MRRNPYKVKDNLLLNDVETTIYEMGFVKRAGIDTIVDLSLRDIGRDVGKLKKISEASGVNIIAGCGLYTYDTVEQAEETMSAEQLAEWMVGELTVGIEGTGIKAGVIGEIGTSETIRPVEEKSLHAAGIAQKQTGLPVYVHIYPWGKEGNKALGILMQHGVSPERVCICHGDVTFDYEYLTSVLKRGAYIEFDDFGKEFCILPEPGGFAGGDFAKDSERVNILKKLIDDGYKQQILLANDVCLKVLLHSYGGWGYDHVISNIVPMMYAAGISQEAIDRIIKLNPISFLTGGS